MYVVAVVVLFLLLPSSSLLLDFYSIHSSRSTELGQGHIQLWTFEMTLDITLPCLYLLSSKWEWFHVTAAITCRWSCLNLIRNLAGYGQEVTKDGCQIKQWFCISCHLYRDLRNFLFLSGFSTKSLFVFHFNTIRASCRSPSVSSSYSDVNYICWAVQITELSKTNCLLCRPTQLSFKFHVLHTARFLTFNILKQQNVLI
jgi:hypothetical protein